MTQDSGLEPQQQPHKQFITPIKLPRLRSLFTIEGAIHRNQTLLNLLCGKDLVSRLVVFLLFWAWSLEFITETKDGVKMPTALRAS